MRERLLVRHFLQRFVDNDLSSPRADRHQVLSVAGSALVACSIVCTVFLAAKFMLVSIQMPAQTAMGMLADRFFFFGLSMVVLALAGVGVWHAVALDERDATILGPLPLRHAMVVRAKLKALAVFALAFVAGLNVFSGTAYPLAAINTLPLGLAGVLVLVSAQLVVSVLAGLFGFVCVIAVRESLRLLAGPRLFARISSLAQALLVVVLGTLLLLLPSAMSSAPAWLASPRGMARLNPVLWFLGLNERLAGHVLTRWTSAPPYPPVAVAIEQRAAAQYAAIQPHLDALAGRALLALGIVFAIGLATYLWNSRRPVLGVPLRARGRSRIGRGVRRIAIAALRTPAARAGFFFTIKAMWRSAPHRVSLSTTAGVAIAATTVLLGHVSFRQVDQAASAPGSVFGIPLVAIGLLAVGFWHSMRVPAELRANWILQLCWKGDERAYVSGVKSAGITAVGLPALAATLWIGAATLPAPAFVAQGVCDVLLTVVVFDIIMFRCGQWPFASAYTPQEHIAEVAPVYAFGFLVATFALSLLQQRAFSTVSGSAWLIGAILVAVVAIRAVDARPHPSRAIEVWNRELVPSGRVNLSGADW